MSAEATAAVRNLTLQGVEVPPTERFVLYAIANYADEHGRCWPGLNAIMVYTGLSRRTIIRAISDLKNRGLLSTQERLRNNGSRTSNHYMMNFMNPAWKPQVSQRHPPRVTVTPPPCQVDTPPVSGWHPQNYSLEETLEETGNFKANVNLQKPTTKTKPTTLSAAPTSVSNQRLLEVWNQNSGVLPKVQRLNSKRNAALSRLQKELGADTERLFTQAVRQVASDRYWIENSYGFDNLIRDGRVVEKAEKFAAYGTMSAGDRKMAQSALRIAEAIGGFDAQ